MADAQPSRIAVLACGNVSRGDDALGPLLLERIAALELSAVLAIEDFQFQIEHALDLEGADIALFIDAGTGTPAPFTFAEVKPGPPLSHSTHAIEPSAVLAVYRTVTSREPPPAFVLCIRGDAFELGTKPSAAAMDHLDQAFAFIEPLLRELSAERWRAAAGT